MAHVRFTGNLNRFFPGLAPCEVDAATVRELIGALDGRYPGMAGYLIDDAGRLRPHGNVFTTLGNNFPPIYSVRFC